MTVPDFHSTAERAVDFALSEGQLYWLHVPKGSKLNDQPFAIVAVDRGLTVYHGLIGCLSTMRACDAHQIG